MLLGLRANERLLRLAPDISEECLLLLGRHPAELADELREVIRLRVQISNGNPQDTRDSLRCLDIAIVHGPFVSVDANARYIFRQSHKHPQRALRQALLYPARLQAAGEYRADRGRCAGHDNKHDPDLR